MSAPKPTVPFPNTYWVVPEKFLAGEHPVDVKEEVSRARVSRLLEAGIRTFVDLTEEQELKSYYPLLRGLAEEQLIEVTFVRLPIPDRGVPSVWTLRCILDLVDRSLADENPVFVHCFAGRGRTGTVVGCYLKRHGLATEADVIMKIAELRRFMPIAEESSPHTPLQVRMAENWKHGA
jgi:protein-tyrosine phosphatase